MVCTGKNIANGSKNPPFSLSCAHCACAVHTRPHCLRPVNITESLQSLGRWRMEGGGSCASRGLFPHPWDPANDVNLSKVSWSGRKFHVAMFLHQNPWCQPLHAISSIRGLFVIKAMRVSVMVPLSPAFCQAYNVLSLLIQTLKLLTQYVCVCGMVLRPITDTAMDVHTWQKP